MVHPPWSSKLGTLIALLALVALSALSVGCRSSICQRMVDCCREVREVEGIGEACGELAQQTKAPETCRSVLETIRYIYEDRGESPPDICRISTSGESS